VERRRKIRAGPDQLVRAGGGQGSRERQDAAELARPNAAETALLSAPPARASRFAKAIRERARGSHR